MKAIRPTLGIKTADVVDGFYSFLGFPRLVSSSVVKKAIAKGIADSFFGYYSGSTPALGSDGKYQVPLPRVRFNTSVTEDEIDLESGFLLMPGAVPATAPSPTTPGTEPATVTAVGPGRWTFPNSYPDARVSDRRTGGIPLWRDHSPEDYRHQLLRRPKSVVLGMERHREPRRHGRQNHRDRAR